MGTRFTCGTTHKKYALAEAKERLEDAEDALAGAKATREQWRIDGAELLVSHWKRLIQESTDG